MQLFQLNYFQKIILGFATLILLGAFLLMLPVSGRNHLPTPFLDALFTSTSASCVTGLIVYDTATHWSLFGQVVILFLIQIGGLGVVVAVTSVILLSGKKIAYSQRNTLASSISISSQGGIMKMLIFLLKWTGIIELFFAVLLATQFIPEFGVRRGIWYSIFHSVSAFCNAGFDLMGIKEPFSSLTDYVGNPVINISIMCLILLGGLGFMTWQDIAKKKGDFHRYRLQSKIILLTTIFIVLLPAIFYFFIEFRQMPIKNRILASLFTAVTPRTAGFNTVDFSKFSDSGIFLQTLLMLVGAAPGSTGGGMKLTTMTVLLLTSIAIFKNSSRTEAFGRTIPDDVIRNATTIALMYIGLCVLSAMFISLHEKLPLLTTSFETASAIATVGLTLGITPTLSPVSHMILILLMYIGRVGGLCLIYAVFPNANQNRGRLVEENVIVG
nr:potassium transporter TrkG [uncultured Oribacterium sp.]